MWDGGEREREQLKVIPSCSRRQQELQSAKNQWPINKLTDGSRQEISHGTKTVEREASSRESSHDGRCHGHGGGFIQARHRPASSGGSGVGRVDKDGAFRIPPLGRDIRHSFGRRWNTGKRHGERQNATGALSGNYENYLVCGLDSLRAAPLRSLFCSGSVVEAVRDVGGPRSGLFTLRLLPPRWLLHSTTIAILPLL